jgi:hypothetical protein
MENSLQVAQGKASIPADEKKTVFITKFWFLCACFILAGQVVS